jgi:hypothetical protein
MLYRPHLVGKWYEEEQEEETIGNIVITLLTAYGTVCVENGHHT